MTAPKHAAGLRTMPAMLLHNAEQDADARFVMDESGTLTRGEAVQLARGMSYAFSRLGVGSGDTVAIMVDNRREFLASWFGLACMGAIEVPINPANVGERLVHILNHSRSRVLVVQGENVHQVDEVADRLEHLERVVVVGEGSSSRFETVPWSELDADPDAGDLRPSRFSDIVAVMYTSGSTGPAKGAMLSHGHHWTNGAQPTSLFDIGPKDTVYCCLPLHHNMAQGYGVWVAIVSGAAIRIGRKFQADTFWADVQKHDATVLSFVGAMLLLLAKRPPSVDDADNPLRVGFGVPIPAELHEPFERRFGMELVHAYGSTEATIVAWNTGAGRVVGAAGRPLPGYELAIVDEDDQALAAGQIGEIAVRPREPFSMFSGYWREPERTVRAWRNLWFHTGDRGRLDDDGKLWFSDRIDDVVRRMGEFVSSHEVEQAVLSHPDVQMAAVYGVPSELVEDELMVAVVRQPDSAIDATALRAFCAARLPRFAVPRFIDFRDELPMTPTGKVEKYKLKKAGVTPTTDDARANEKERR
jgi:crotonobetaine/carnitine-CoA ligase